MHKFIVPVLVFCCVQVLSYDFPLDVLDKKSLECLQRLKLDINVLISHFDEKLYLPEDNSEVNTFFEKTTECENYFEDDGKFIKHLLERDIKASYLPVLKRQDLAESVPNIAEKCIHIKDENIGVRLSKAHNCVVRAIHDL
ncbi:hypothetical protein FQA39_LY11549 [Lamprigera yunnana]|nr:hypothetical protein FQA39_LY11549 [Lamprigera yunnana]